jgi:hypothetical protein
MWLSSPTCVSGGGCSPAPHLRRVRRASTMNGRGRFLCAEPLPEVLMTQVLSTPGAPGAEVEPKPKPGLTAADRKLRTINLFAVLVPFAGLIAAMLLAWGRWFDWTHLIVLWAMATITAGGVTVGYHRLCTHKSFSAPAWVRYCLAAAGSMAVQGAVFRWVGEHRRHHQHSDTEGDPHSPHMGVDGSWGEGIWATARGFFHAHMGWLFRDPLARPRQVHPRPQRRSRPHRRQPAFPHARPRRAHHPGNPGRRAHVVVDGRAAGLSVGWTGACAAGAPHHLERELRVPSVGCPPI